MALKREKKQKIIEDLKEKIQKQKSVIFVDFSNVDSKILSGLREELKKLDGYFQVTKKTLLKKVLENLKEEKLLEKVKEIKGQLAFAFGFGDEMVPAKVCYKYSKENENLKILGGILGNEFLAPEKVIELAKIPSRKELLQRLVGVLQNPISGLTNVLKGNIKGLLYVLAKAKT